MNDIKTPITPEMETLKSKLKATWMAGDFGEIARSYKTSAEEFVERLNLRNGEKVLDVACGTGSTAIPAARAGAEVTGIDIASNLIEQAKKNAEAENLACRFEEGDAENLAFDDGIFDTEITMFGAMFAPRPEKVSEELARVCRPGGRIVMANWVPAGFAGKMFKINASYVPPPDMPPPVLWGDEKVVGERLKGFVSDLKFNRRFVAFNFPVSPAEVVEHFRSYFGPTQKAFEALKSDGEKQNALRDELVKHWADNNQATDGTTKVESEYLEVLATRA